jgi:ribosomal protein S18 acetylase RimI-like enzyme
VTDATIDPRRLVATDPTRFDVGGAALDCSLVPWDTETFGFPVAQIDRLELPEGTDHAALLARFDSWCDEREVRFVSCRLDHTKLRESMALEERGFRFVEMVYGPRLAPLDAIDDPRHRIRIGEAEGGDVAAIERIAASAFSTGRFLLDWRLPSELSHRRYASWVRRSHARPDQTVLKAELDDELIGFFIVEHRADLSVYWHLTAVSPDRHGQGIGMSLWRTMLRRHQEAGITAVETTISGHNARAINLYARLGFTFAAPQMTLHWVRT